MLKMLVILMTTLSAMIIGSVVTSNSNPVSATTTNSFDHRPQQQHFFSQFFNLVVTQREGPIVTASGSGTEVQAQSKAECRSNEAVTGGGWERIDTLTASQNREIIKEAKEGNAWVVTGSSTFQPITFKAYAECTKIGLSR